MAVDFQAIEALLQAAVADGRATLFEHEVYQLIKASGAVHVPATLFVPKGRPIPRDALDRLPGARVVLKIVATGIAHKSDRGGVLFVDRDLDTVSATATGMLAIDYAPDANVRGLLICECVQHDASGFGSELFVGMRSAREFGPIVAAGLGGVQTEFFASRLPKSQALATALAFETSGREFFDLFRKTVAYELLAGRARGTRRIVPDEHLIECFDAFVQMARVFCVAERGDRPVITELEVNPFAFRDGYMVPLDGLCQLGYVPPDPPPRPIEKLERLLHPKSIAVVGVSAKAMNMGRVILNNLRECGFDRGRTYVIKEGLDELDGVRCVAGLADLPETVDLLVVAVSADQVPALVDQLDRHAKAETVILIPGGLGETEGGKQTEQELARRIAEAHTRPGGGPVYVGGNCLGIQSRPGRYDTFFIPASKLAKRWSAPGRRVALISQSGAYVITRMSNLETLDPSYAISVGNQMDLTVSDFLQFLGRHDLADVYGVYMEGFKDRDGLAFAQAVSLLSAAGKDVIFYKAGRTAAGRSATAGHTASIAGDYNVCAAAAANAGALVAETFKEFEYLTELATHLYDRRIGGTRLGAISNAGYETVGMADAVAGPHYEVSLPPLSGECSTRIREVLAKHRLEGLVNPRNPLDLTPMATDECHEECIRAMLASDDIDAVVASFVPLTPAMKTTPDEIAAESSMVHRLPGIYADTDKPLVVVIDSGPLYDPLAQAVRGTGVPVFRSADSAVRSLGRYLYHKATLRRASALRGADETEPRP